MTFTQLTPRGINVWGGQRRPDVTCAVHRNGLGNPSFCITFSATAIQRLGWNPDADRIVILEGTGRDIGFIKAAPGFGHGSLKLSSAGGQKSNRSGSMILKISTTNFRANRIPAEPQGAIEVMSQIFGSEALIMLPEWVKPFGKDAP